ncbi:MAG: amidohydrolase family protein, partial [Chloroflexota bacterium]|nr:amidohydrolase family protein [Chloroflexota bacterium]
MNVERPVERFALANGRVILPREIVAGKVVVVEGDKIAGIARTGDLGVGTRTIDVGGRYIAPGLIDIHVHGARGHTFNEPAAAAFAAIAGTHIAHGITSLLATLATASIDDLVACLEFSRQWSRHPRAGARVLGVHLEGPYFS